MPIIRRLDVPPFEGLDPFLPRINSADAATREGVARILARVAGEGETAGPDLTAVGRRFQRREVLQSIVYPSHDVSDQ